MFQFLAMPQAGCRRWFPRHLLHRIATLAAIVITAVVAELIYTQTVNAESSERPNIVLIMADDMGYECVEANGGTSYATPRLNALAASGLRFEHGYSQPICTPSRVQIMTGIYNQRNYIRFGLLDPEATTFSQLLRDAGYATCIAGKWQLEGGIDAPDHFGFDEYCLWQLVRRPGRYPNPGLEINGKKVDYTDGEYGPDIASDYLCDFIRRNKEGPFLAYYPMILPHWPFEPTPDSPDWDPTAEGVLRGQGDPKYFGDMVAYTDKMVGKVIDCLEECGIRENTLVIFTGDNGTATSVVSMMGDRKVKGGKGSTTDAGTRVPFIASWPAVVEPGATTQALVDFSDILPTLCEVAGVAVPTRLDVDGRSFLPVLTGEKESVRDWTYCWYARNGGPKGAEFARDWRYKLYRDGSFYDIANDPLEQNRLAHEDLVALDGEQSAKGAEAAASDAEAAGSGSALASYKKLEGVLDRYEGTRRLPGK